MLKWLVLASMIVVLVAAGAIFYSTSMPLQSYSGPLKPLNEDQRQIRDGLVVHVQKLATAIGQRNLEHYPALVAAAEYIENTLRTQGYTVQNYPYSVQGSAVRNIEVRIGGSKSPTKNLIIGAHYDSAEGTPGANDNGTGVAALLELARVLKTSKPEQTIRLVFFANEEPPYFQTADMGSLVYARQLHKENASVSGMISLETIGYYSDEPGTQQYPAGLSLLYPSTGNFIGFVGNTGSRDLVRKAVRAFRESSEFPSEGVAAPADLAGIGWSDHWSFWQEGYEGIMVTDTAQFRYRYYHQLQDTADKVDFDRMARVVAGIKQVIVKLAKD